MKLLKWLIAVTLTFILALDLLLDHAQDQKIADLQNQIEVTQKAHDELVRSYGVILVSHSRYLYDLKQHLIFIEQFLGADDGQPQSTIRRQSKDREG